MNGNQLKIENSEIYSYSRGVYELSSTGLMELKNNNFKFELSKMNLNAAVGNFSNNEFYFEPSHYQSDKNTVWNIDELTLCRNDIEILCGSFLLSGNNHRMERNQISVWYDVLELRETGKLDLINSSIYSISQTWISAKEINSNFSTISADYGVEIYADKINLTNRSGIRSDQFIYVEGQDVSFNNSILQTYDYLEVKAEQLTAKGSSITCREGIFNISELFFLENSEWDLGSGNHQINASELNVKNSKFNVEGSTENSISFVTQKLNAEALTMDVIGSNINFIGSIMSFNTGNFMSSAGGKVYMFGKDIQIINSNFELQANGEIKFESDDLIFEDSRLSALENTTFEVIAKGNLVAGINLIDYLSNNKPNKKKSITN
jgi:hypothetical protein